MRGEIAIVGCGASLIWSGFGAEIDARQSIVRVPLDHGDLETTIGGLASGSDVGRRIDMAIVGAVHHHKLPPAPGSLRQLWVYVMPGKPLPAGGALRGNAWTGRWIMPVYAIAEANHVYRSLQAGVKLGQKSRKFSRGTAAIVIALALGYRPIYAYGFDNMAAGVNATGDPASYPGVVPIEGKIPAPRTHDYAAEKKLVAVLAEKYETTIIARFPNGDVVFQTAE